MKTDHICVGGPLSGKRIPFEGDTYHVPVRRGSPLLSGYLDPAKKVDMETITYRPTIIGLNTVVWVPEGQTNEETLEMLVDAFEKYFSTGEPDGQD